VQVLREPRVRERFGWQVRVRKYGCAQGLSPWYIKVQNENDGCPPQDPECVSSDGCTSPGAPHRFHTWDNVRTDVPCSSE